MRTIVLQLYCFLFSCAVTMAQEQQKMYFSEIENGLYNTWISCIEQDQKGFIWIGTQDGLHRYDGYTFEVFRNSAKDIPSLGANWIRTITLDAKNNYWIGTYGNGLIKFSPESTSFKKITHDEPEALQARVIRGANLIDNNKILSATDIGFQIQDTDTNSVSNLGFGQFDSAMALAEGELFLTENEHLFKYDSAANRKQLVHSFESKIKLLQYIPDQGLIIGLKEKLVLYEKNQFTKQIPLDELIVAFISDNKGGHIAATAKSLFKFDSKKFKLEPISTDLNFEKQAINTIFLDRQNNLWLGTGKGLFKERKYNKAFIRNGVAIHARRIAKHKGALYFGGDEGLFKIKESYPPIPLTENKISALCAEGNVLLASKGIDEIYKFKNDTHYSTITVSNTEGNAMVYGLAKDRQKRVWVGSWQGLHVFNEEDELLKSIPVRADLNDSDSKIINIHIDSKDRLWIITAAYGIFMLEGASDDNLDSVASRMVNFRAMKGVSNTLTSDVVFTLEEDRQGRMWFGTGLGVVHYQEETGDFSRLHYQNDLFDKKVMAIRTDSNDNLWISTINNGLYVHNEKDRTIRHFTENDGLISNAFLFGSGLYDDTTDHMYFGTDEGVQKIDLSQYTIAKRNIHPIVTDIQVNDSEGKIVIAPAQAPFLKAITLEPSQNDFSIRFSGMDFVAPEKICYAYSLDDSPWKMTDLQTAYFTNVPYGSHQLKFKALHDGSTTNDNLATLDIQVQPPWFFSRTAKALYLLLLVTTAWGVYQYLKWRWKMRYNLKIKEEETERLKELNDLKSKMYTNIAHEFKTPLTLIAGPIDSKLCEGNISEQDRANFSIVRRNASRLTSLVDQLLELASLEKGKLRLNVSLGNLGLFISMLSKSFEYQAQLKKVSYDIEVERIKEVWYDEDIIEKIVTNLLSNAFKYVPKEGKCWFLVKKSQDFIEIVVKNTVRNSSELHLDKLFTRFYQDDSYSEGIGVGLALVEELVTLYDGTIEVALEENEIIRFSVRLPCPPGPAREAKPLSYGAYSHQEDLVAHLESKVQNDKTSNREFPLVLLVEDHIEIRAFIKQVLEANYRILEAENGIKGLEIALSQIPDIILSDIRMPHCSGIELCHALKNDEKTSHIPVILLTGSGGEENELRGLGSGADDVITKPFKIRILEKRVANLIGQRKKLRDRYSQELILKPKGIAVSSADEVFLNKVQDILDEHLYDPSFNSAVFSKKALMSRMQLHRKLLAFTGLSTSAFIRSQRLKQAITLLETSDININEVAYTTGFNTPTYFMKCFKETFKKTPSEYLLSLQD